jgi:hypothetical protein
MNWQNITLFLYIIFALAIFFPSFNAELKLPFFGAAIFFSVCSVLVNGGKLFLHRKILILTCLYALTGLFWVQLGLIKGAPGAIAVSTVYVIWPLVFLLMINQMNTEVHFRRLCWIFVVVSTLAVAADIGFLLQGLGLIPMDIFSIVDSRDGFGLRAGSPSYTSTRVCLFLFIIPLCFAMILHRWRSGTGRGAVLYGWLMLVVSIIMVIIAQRRSIFVIIGLAPFLAFFTDLIMPREPGRLRPRYIPFVFGGVLVVLLVLYTWMAGYFEYVDWNRMSQRFAQGFDFSGHVVSVDPGLA